MDVFAILEVAYTGLGRLHAYGAKGDRPGKASVVLNSDSEIIIKVK